MPCTDGGVPYPRDPNELEDSELRALACGAMQRLYELGQHGSLDYKQMGVSRQRVRAWWKAHLAEDKKRIEREKIEAEKARLRTRAVSKLTKEELAAIIEGNHRG